MTTEHPITPPPALVREWNEAAIGTHFPPYGYSEYIATHAARWGADQELEACCEWLEKGPYGFTITASAPHMISDLREARRPKPPNLVEEALNTLGKKLVRFADPEGYDTIRRALERLKELEQGNE